MILRLIDTIQMKNQSAKTGQSPLKYRKKH